MPRRITPADRAAKLDEQKRIVTRKYKSKSKLNTSRKFQFEGEEELVVDMVVMLKLANYTNSQIAMIVGVSRAQVKKYLDDGNVQKRYMALRAKLPEAAFELGRAYLIEAVQQVVTVMRTSVDDAVTLKAAAELFDRFGIPKISRNETKPSDADNDNPLNDSLMDKLRAAAPEVQERAAELQSMFEEGLERLLSGNEIGDSHGSA